MGEERSEIISSTLYYLITRKADNFKMLKVVSFGTFYFGQIQHDDNEDARPVEETKCTPQGFSATDSSSKRMNSDLSSLSVSLNGRDLKKDNVAGYDPTGRES